MADLPCRQCGRSGPTELHSSAQHLPAVGQNRASLLFRRSRGLRPRKAGSWVTRTPILRQTRSCSTAEICVLRSEVIGRSGVPRVASEGLPIDRVDPGPSTASICLVTKAYRYWDLVQITFCLSPPDPVSSSRPTHVCGIGDIQQLQWELLSWRGVQRSFHRATTPSESSTSKWNDCDCSTLGQHSRPCDRPLPLGGSRASNHEGGP